jgi:hypothetical protein
MGLMKRLKFATALAIGIAALATGRGEAQQFNSDSYLSKPLGMATIILTYGQRNSMFMNTFSLLPGWEFTAAAYVYDDDRDASTDDGYSTSLYAKYMFYENKAKTGGFAVKAGTGLDPGYLDEANRLKDAFRTYWTNTPVTLPLFDNKLSWDVMPGASVTTDFGPENTTAWVFTYTSRMAWYPASPTWSIVGEVVGAEGKGTAPAEYRAGLRWEPNPYAVFALTYDQEFKSNNGAGWEFGMMLFSPPFFCIGDCK